MPYWLLITWKTIGSFQTAARLSASWKPPVLVAPSPNWQSTTPWSPVVERQRRADRDRQMAADDAPAAQEATLDVEQVHRAAVAAGHAGLLAEQLGHDGRPGRTADRERRAVVAVAREQVVAVVEAARWRRRWPPPRRSRGGSSRRSGRACTALRCAPRSVGSASSGGECGAPSRHREARAGAVRLSLPSSGASESDGSRFGRWSTSRSRRDALPHSPQRRARVGHGLRHRSRPARPSARASTRPSARASRGSNSSSGSGAPSAAADAVDAAIGAPAASASAAPGEYPSQKLGKTASEASARHAGTGHAVVAATPAARATPSRCSRRPPLPVPSTRRCRSRTVGGSSA